MAASLVYCKTGGIADYVRMPALNPRAAFFYPRFFRNDKNIQCYSFINSVFKDRSDGFTTPDVCGSCLNSNSFTLNPSALDFSPNMDKSFILNPNAPEFYPDVTIVDSQRSPDWDISCPNPTSQSNEQDPYYILNQLRLSNINKVIIGHLNINSLRNKFEMLMAIVKGTGDILVVSGNKIR